MTDGYYAFLHLSFDVRPLTIEDADGQRSPLDVVLQLGQFHELGGRKEVEEEDRRNQTAVIREVRLSGDKLTPLESQVRRELKRGRRGSFLRLGSLYDT